MNEIGCESGRHYSTIMLLRVYSNDTLDVQ